MHPAVAALLLLPAARGFGPCGARISHLRHSCNPLTHAAPSRIHPVILLAGPNDKTNATAPSQQRCASRLRLRRAYSARRVSRMRPGEGRRPLNGRDVVHTDTATATATIAATMAATATAAVTATAADSTTTVRPAAAPPPRPPAPAATSTLAPFAARLTPSLADSLLAAVGAGASLAILVALSDLTSLRWYAPPLAASAIIFFVPTTPLPNLRAILSATCALLLAACFSLEVLHLEADVARPVTIGLGLLYLVQSRNIYPPAAALAALLIDKYIDGAADASSGGLSPLLEYALFPCVSSHLVLFALAAPLQQLRNGVRLALAMRQRPRLSEAQLEEELQASLSQVSLKSHTCHFAPRGPHNPDFLHTSAVMNSSHFNIPPPLLTTTPHPPPNQIVFKSYDLSGDGLVDSSEVASAMRLGKVGKEVGLFLEAAEARILSKAQQGGDEVRAIDYAEFTELVRKLS